ncbi:helix-turn-helix transcriptional regulator [Nakamurella flavida]|uniref:Helix-turn-helix transcriptional regulator n=1 Tax=Nakamurella flavida TaxID=363630 RepID=A0A938YGF5_9ACTN|nr:XRE family transcriptional regulator [Nakamurella flavida]MBM9477231.1 helix-turn-helix transcriptional regulator [Nakamurella flavida]MDP9780181.1 transcriptional regulator with XRE-family HTH domain [Nakamurella flavida]
MSPNDGAPLAIIAAALQRERHRAGLSLAEVARRAGIAKSTLSQLEAGVGNPSIETLWALSTTLNVNFARLVEPPRNTVTLVRAGSGPSVASGTADYRTALLSAGPPGARRDLYLITAEPDRTHRSAPHAAGVVEHLVLGTGRALVGPAEDPVELGPGDYLGYPGDIPHLFRALAPGTTAVIVSEHI